AGRALVAIDGASRRAGDDLIRDHGSAVYNNPDPPPDQRDVDRVPDVWIARCIHARHEELVHRARGSLERHGVAAGFQDYPVPSAREDPARGTARYPELGVNLHIL